MLLGPRSRGLHIWLLKGKHSGSWSGLELSNGMPCRGIGQFDSVDLRVSWRFATPQRAQGTRGTCSLGPCPLPFPLGFLPAKALFAQVCCMVGAESGLEGCSEQGNEMPWALGRQRWSQPDWPGLLFKVLKVLTFFSQSPMMSI